MPFVCWERLLLHFYHSIIFHTIDLHSRLIPLSETSAKAHNKSHFIHIVVVDFTLINRSKILLIPILHHEKKCHTRISHIYSHFHVIVAHFDWVIYGTATTRYILISFRNEMKTCYCDKFSCCKRICTCFPLIAVHCSIQHTNTRKRWGFLWHGFAQLLYNANKSKTDFINDFSTFCECAHEGKCASFSQVQIIPKRIS